MSDPWRFITVEKLNVGISPDHEGVLVILNPGKSDETLFTLTARSAIQVSEALQEYATKLSEVSEVGRQAQPRRAESNSIVIDRERGENLDS
jgi:hypothetical protein